MNGRIWFWQRSVREELDDLVTWVENERLLMEDWGLARHLKPGYRALFHGPPGTGKTVTAAVIGKRLGLPVYRVDLSRVVSKWIGETEKNLAALFDHAADGDMILFFDEADALFGKRGDDPSANDRHANQQIAYLLQRIEDCPGRGDPGDQPQGQYRRGLRPAIPGDGPVSRCPMHRRGGTCGACASARTIAASP